IRKEVTLTIYGDHGGQEIHLLTYLPPSTRKPVPIFLGLNFEGNHTINPDPGITLAMQWIQKSKGGLYTAERAPESSRGKSIGRWAVENILARGYGVATVYAGDIEPDFNNSFRDGIHSMYFKSDQYKPEPAEWGTVAAWAWGLSRVMDYFEKDKDIDAKKVVVTGHSRMGKAALWAGATDQRFAIVISNNSGEGGAALARRWFGETTVRINTSFPHWFSGNFKKYNDHENDLPFDQHELIALMAPRPVYIASAQEDQWADPKGEFLSGFHAESVYKLYGKKGLGVTEQPATNQSVGDFIGYHIRTGKHDVTDFDWAQYLDFADRHFGQSKK
ncbi:MAG: acetylxylan esterase, partial [Opitutaceae bacterium]|nr:acetylxylan esterase [Verrucomicrobiales bacterium]